VFGAPNPTSRGNKNKIQLLQNRASRFIYGKNRTHELNKFIVSREDQLSYLDIMLFFFKYQKCLLDSSVTEEVQEGWPVRDQDDRLI
jgi:hypothetical protein